MRILWLALHHAAYWLAQEKCAEGGMFREKGWNVNNHSDNRLTEITFGVSD